MWCVAGELEGGAGGTKGGRFLCLLYERMLRSHWKTKEDTSLKAPKLCLQGAGSDEAFARAFDTVTDSDNVAMPAPAVHDA